MKMKARMFATMAHKNQRRKLTNDPYISHPIRVAKQLERHSVHEELVCAGYLHDVVEDTSYTIEDIEEHFGERVAKLVAAHTEDKTKSWQERKQATIDMMKTCEKDMKMLIVADKLDNLLDLQENYEHVGESIWDSFNAGKAQQQWYNESIAEHMYEGFTDEEIPEFFKLYEETIKEVFH